MTTTNTSSSSSSMSFSTTGARHSGRVHYGYDQVHTAYSAASIAPFSAHIREDPLYGQIDPNLFRDSSSPDDSSQFWQVPVPGSCFQQSPNDACLDPNLTHDASSSGIYQVDYVRNGSPASFQGSPVFSLTKSPSIGSDGSYDLVTDPPTPPDAQGNVISLGTPYDSDYYESNTKQPEVSYYAGSQDEDINRHVANQAYYNVESHEFNGQYMFDTAPRCNSLDHINAHGAHINAAKAGTRHYSPCATLPYANSARHIKEESMPPSTEKGVLTTRVVKRRNRSSQYRYDPISSGKQASVDHEVSSQGDKKRKVYSTNKRFCHKCKKHFPSRGSLDEHTGMVHPRPYICVFHYAGCTARFDAKNEWKRHVSTKHLGLKYWVCMEGKCADERQSVFQQRAGLEPNGNIFNRKDLYTQHIRRMHSNIAGQSTTDYKGADARSDFMVKRMQEDALRIRCRLPTWMPCPVKSCDKSFKGSNAWDERMEHVAQQHFENAAAGKEPPVEFGGLHDYVLTEWAQRPEIRIVKQTELGWELCDPLKGDTEYRMATATSDGEE
ncbi:hypothetical protein GGI43DRAFT_247066 [Trichoderma evansii]